MAGESDAARAPELGAQTQLVENVQRLLDFSVSQAVVKIDAAEIDRVTAALSVSTPLSPPQEAELWKAYNTLSALIHPATAESVKAIYDLNDDRKKRPSFWRQWCKDPLARREISWSIVWVIAALIPLIVVQCYSLGLSSILETITKYETTLDETREDLARVQRTQADAASDIPSLTIEFNALDARRIEDESVINASYEMLLGTTAFWASIVLDDCVAEQATGCPSPNSNDAAHRQKQINIRNASIALLKGLSLYLLPLLYGLLGANVYILRQLLSKLDRWTLDLLSVSKHHLRRVLGVLLGAMVGLVFESNEDAISSTGFGLAALAFLAGYSAEFIFSILDTFIDRAKSAFSSKPHYEPQAAPKTTDKVPTKPTGSTDEQSDKAQNGDKPKGEADPKNSGGTT